MNLNHLIFVFLFAASIAALSCQPYSMITSDSFNPPCGDTFTTRLQNDVLTVFSEQPPCNYESAPSLSYFLDSSISISEITSLEYNISWSQPMTNCTFGIGDANGFFLNMTDQLGLSNNPNEDLKGFSNGWFARRFVLDQQAVTNSGRSSDFRFGFICSRTASNETIYRSFDFNRIRVFRGESDKVGLDLMDPLQKCKGCPQPIPAIGMQCQINGSVMTWVYDGDLTKSYLEVTLRRNVLILGNLNTRYLEIGYNAQLNLTGCLSVNTNMDGAGPIKIYLSGYYHTNNSWTIYTGPNCPLPSIFIVDGMSMGSPCPDFFSATYRLSGSNVITFEWIREVDQKCWDNEYNDVDWRLILVIVLPCCAVIAGVIIAIVFGVRKHKKRQMERQEKLEEMTRSGFTINPKNDIEK